MTRAVLAVLALALLLPSTAVAQADNDAETQANFTRAATYWGASPDCPDGVRVIVDQAYVDTNAARGVLGGCDIWIGDNFAAETSAQKCQTITHEWGHLLGHDHVAGLPDDPVGVMVSFNLSPACAALEAAAATAHAAAIAPAVAAWAAYDAAYVRWAHQRMARFDCRATANGLRRRASRVAARARCVKRYGAIRRGPAEPAVPRPT